MPPTKKTKILWIFIKTSLICIIMKERKYLRWDHFNRAKERRPTLHLCKQRNVEKKENVEKRRSLEENKIDDVTELSN